MAQTLTLNLPGTVFDTLTTTAKRAGLSVEDVAIDWVEQVANKSIEDSLLQLAGVLESHVEDVGTQHDKFLGEQLRETHD